MTWYDAIEYCQSLDAYLAEVLNNETQILLETHASLLPPTNWWLGASDEETVSKCRFVKSNLNNSSKILDKE